MVRLTAAELFPYRLPFRHAVRLPSGLLNERQGFLLRLRGEDGTCGHGEAAPVWWTGEEPLETVGESLWALINWINTGGVDSESLEEILHAVPGCAPPSRVDQRLRRSTESRAARCALDSARLDLIARQQGLSVAEMLGGQPGANLACNGLIATSDPDEVGAAAAALVGAGFRTIKLKVGGQPLDIERRRIAALRYAGAGVIRIRLDANRAWDLPTAARSLAALGGTDIAYVEEPLRNPDPEDLRRLRRETSVAIALDESVIEERDIARFAGAFDVVILKLARVGGPSRAVAIATAAARIGLAVVFTDSIETAIGRAATVHAACAAPSPRMAVGLAGSGLLAADVCGTDPIEPAPLVIVGGPGLGVTPNGPDWGGNRG